MSAETRSTSSTGGSKGVKLERFDLIPIGPLTELAEHYGRGARKYANHQWRQGYEWSKSYAALQRHLTAFWDGQDYDVCSNDPEGCGGVLEGGEADTCLNHTGSHHMAAVAWHAFLLLEFKDRYPQHDDRYKVPVAEPESDPEAPVAIPFGQDALKGATMNQIWAIPPTSRAKFDHFGFVNLHQSTSEELIEMMLAIPVEPTGEADSEES